MQYPTADNHRAPNVQTRWLVKGGIQQIVSCRNALAYFPHNFAREIFQIVCEA